MPFEKQKRNYEGIQFSELRKKFDHPYNDLHDELSAAYYDKKPFRDYGIIDKATFDELHGLIFHHYTVDFHNENLKLKLYDEQEYNHAGQVEAAKKAIAASKKKGITLKL